MSVDTIDDFAFLSFGVGGNGEAWALGGVGDLGGWCVRRSDDGLGMGRIGKGGGWIHERNGGVAELRLSGDDFDGVAEDVDGSRGRGHVVVVWRCCRR